MRNVRSLIVTLAIAGACIGATEQGPGPILNEQNEEGLPNNPVAGAINAIAPSRTSPNVIFVGTVNGGVWKTSNATAASPTWIPLTDRQLPELSINSLAISPVNSDAPTLFAGTGSTSSLGGFGSRGIGVARSTDGGTTWTLLARSTFTGRVINSIVPTMLNGGHTVLAATWLDGGGVYRSTDNGVTFARISGNGVSGLPGGGVTSLIADPANSNRFYAGVPGGPFAGVYRSTNGGTVWAKVNTGLTGLPALRILLTVHNDAINNVVYADVIAPSGEQGGTLSGVFRSANQGGSWTSLGVPSPPIYPGGDNEGGQGNLHGAIAADPSDPNVVFISGDRQDTPFPNANGCSAFSANVFRYTGTVWENAVCNGANGTSPHPDSRSMAFDASGNLLQTNDGGIYRLVSPNTAATRRWVPVVGNIRPTELHSIAYDPLSKIVFGGTQDNGTPIQSSTGSLTWNQLITGDGGVVGVDADQVSHSGTSLRYASSQFFGQSGPGTLCFLQRSTWNAANTMSGVVNVGLNITSGDGTGTTLCQFDLNIQFFQPFVLNAIDPSRMLIGTAFIYESLNHGDSLNNLGSMGALAGNGITGRPIAYGSRLGGIPRSDVFYVGAGNRIFHRVTGGGPINALASYPGGTVITVAMNPNDYRQVYVSDQNNQVWGSFDEGATWTNLTENLPSLTSQVTTIEVFAPDATLKNTVLVAGGFGLFQLHQPGTGGSWTPLNGAGSLIPPALAVDLHYDYTANVLVVGTLGRGSWTIKGPLPVLDDTALAGSRPASPSASAISLPPFRLPPSRAPALPPSAYMPPLGLR